MTVYSLDILLFLFGNSLLFHWLFSTPWTAAYQAPLSMGFSRQEYWSGVPLPSPKLVLKNYMRNLYAGQEATVRTGHGTTDCFQIGKGVCQSCILSPYWFNLYAEYIMRNAGLEEAQAGIKSARRNINNLRYADDTTLIHSVTSVVSNSLQPPGPLPGSSVLENYPGKNTGVG